MNTWRQQKAGIPFHSRWSVWQGTSYLSESAGYATGTTSRTAFAPLSSAPSPPSWPRVLKQLKQAGTQRKQLNEQEWMLQVRRSCAVPTNGLPSAVVRPLNIKRYTLPASTTQTVVDTGNLVDHRRQRILDSSEDERISFSQSLIKPSFILRLPQPATDVCIIT